VSNPNENLVEREWDAAAESWTDFVRKGKDFFREELNNPGMFKLMGNVSGLAILDVACGEGYNTRIMARKGARVVGIDLSKRLIEQAKLQEENDRLGIDYLVMNSADLTGLPAMRFDLVTCFMALMDIEEYDRTLCEIARVMKGNGRFLFSITHPCFEYSADAGKIEMHLNYFGMRSTKVPWRMERLVRPFETTSFHRTLTDYSEALHRHGLVIVQILEPRPTRKSVSKFPALREVLLRPQSIIFETFKEKPKMRKG
jgi:2-polyprenyl-3-methyl-5-hydroxy-6-metoxy-1,4-benzoquinol methylase